jgi:glycosyltransferase involved in cell wall biosynthesis
MREPLVSVIVPVKDEERHLEQALRSVVEQSYTRIEPIVVDGRSADRSREIALSFAGVLCLTQSGTGLSGAWNQGIEACRGELVAFLDGDDHWLPGKLRAQVDLLTERPELAGTVGKARFSLADGSHGPPGLRREILNGEHPAPMPGTLLVRRRVFEEVGLFDPDYLVAMDVDWFARVKDAGLELAPLPMVMLEKRFHDDNLSHTQPQRYRQEMLRAFRASAARQRAGKSPA